MMRCVMSTLVVVILASVMLFVPPGHSKRRGTLLNMVSFSIPPTLVVLSQRTKVVCLATLLTSAQLPQELIVSPVSCVRGNE